jgi:hypothetical protein
MCFGVRSFDGRFIHRHGLRPGDGQLHLGLESLHSPANALRSFRMSARSVRCAAAVRDDFHTVVCKSRDILAASQLGINAIEPVTAAQTQAQLAKRLTSKWAMPQTPFKGNIPPSFRERSGALGRPGTTKRLPGLLQCATQLGGGFLPLSAIRLAGPHDDLI